MNDVHATSLRTLPLLSTAQMREVDRFMRDMYGIDQIQTMENTGWNLALLAKRLLGNSITDRPLVVIAGRGNKGGGGFVAARHLLNWGAWAQIVLTHPSDAYQAVPAHQLATLQAMGAPLAWAEEGWELPPTDLIIDALVGDELHDAPQGKTRNLIHLANSSRAPILSLDAPSGLDATTGQLWTPHIGAAATMILALPKVDLLLAQAAYGDLYLADIGVPPQLYAELGFDVPPLFAQDTILPLQITGESVAITL